MYKFAQTRFFLPDDLVQLVTSFLWKSAKLSADELSEDLDFYCLWRKTVPPIFLKCAILDTCQWFHVANPMRDGHPYWPRKLLDLTPKNVWGAALCFRDHDLPRENSRGAYVQTMCPAVDQELYRQHQHLVLVRSSNETPEQNYDSALSSPRAQGISTGGFRPAFFLHDLFSRR